YDVFRPNSVAGMAQRLRLELGVPPDAEHPGFEIVEHLLLRPVAEDRNQKGEEGEEAVPLLAGVDRSDPYSMQLAVVFREPPAALGKHHAATYEQLVERLVAEHTPAHLGVTLHWFGDETGGKHWSTFLDCHRRFREALAAYRGPQLSGRTASPEELQLAQLRLRDARDWLLEYLLIGATYPLRDIPLPDLIVVPADSDAKIPLGYSQRGVTYRLCDHRSGDAIVTGTGKQQRKYEVQGTGGPVELPTPPVLEDVNYKIMAIRQAGNFTKLGERAAWLHTQVTLKEGVDTTLDAHIEAQILDGTLDNPRSSDARLVYHGDAVDVLVDLSQEGVQYELVDHAQPDRVLSTATVIGTGGTIGLRSLAMTEDIDLRVRARKSLDEEHAGGVIREALLDLILPLRVRASLEPQVVITGGEVLAYGGSSKLEVRDRQASATYRVWIRDAFDEVYVYDPNPAVPVVEVAVPAAGEGEEARTVRLARSEYKRWWYGPARFAATTAGTVSGTSVGFTLGPFSHDQEVIVQALKTHQYGPLDRPSVGARDTA
ncbi:MAG: hypothetical protein KC457_30770, partial [Myxococcales bacterium]|nr:hypothetical protein [Myxococcales bacterium]